MILLERSNRIINYNFPLDIFQKSLVSGNGSGAITLNDKGDEIVAQSKVFSISPGTPINISIPFCRRQYPILLTVILGVPVSAMIV